MSDEARRMAVEAAMDGEAAVVREIGDRIEVSQMEVMVLANVARLACIDEMIAVMAEDGDEGEVAALRQERQDFVRDVRAVFDRGHENGLRRLVQSCIAMMTQERFEPYIVRSEDTSSSDEPRDMSNGN